MNINLNSLKIGNVIAKLPIIQGGMGVGISLSSLASAVANEGGIGVISTAAIGMNEPDFISNYLEANIRVLKREIRKARELSKGIIGVNIMTALSNFVDMVKTSIDEGVDVIFSGAGLPLNLPQYLNETSRTALVPIVSSARAASIIAKRWFEKYNYVPDAIVVEGPKAGGHLGFSLEQLEDEAYSLEKIVPELISEVKLLEEKFNKNIPVIAGGGIYSGEDIHTFLKLGASGVQMGTRFVTTNECDASVEFKNAYVNAKKEDIVIIKSPVGLPGRAIRNTFIDEVRAGIRQPFKCLYHCIKTCEFKTSPYCIAQALTNAKEGRLNLGFAFAGENAYMTREIISVKQLIKTLLEEYSVACVNA